MEEVWGNKSEGSKGDAEEASNDASSHLEDRGGEKTELTKIGEACGDMDVVG